MTLDLSKYSYWTDPRWQKRRLGILSRDEFACQQCSSGLQDERELHVIRLKYHRTIKPWDYPSEELTTLCDRCHQERVDRVDNIGVILQPLKEFHSDVVLGFATATHVYCLNDPEMFEKEIDFKSVGFNLGVAIFLIYTGWVQDAGVRDIQLNVLQKAVNVFLEDMGEGSTIETMSEVIKMLSNNINIAHHENHTHEEEWDEG